MSHEEYVEMQRKRVASIAKGMLDGTVDYLEGAIQLSSLWHEVEVAGDDPDFIAFIEIASETDHLPIGRGKQYWSKEALERHNSEIQDSIKWAKEISLNKCKSLVKRFSN